MTWQSSLFNLSDKIPKNLSLHVVPLHMASFSGTKRPFPSNSDVYHVHNSERFHGWLFRIAVEQLDYLEPALDCCLPWFCSLGLHVLKKTRPSHGNWRVNYSLDLFQLNWLGQTYYLYPSISGHCFPSKSWQVEFAWLDYCPKGHFPHVCMPVYYFFFQTLLLCCCHLLS